VVTVLLEYGADVDAAAPEPDRYWPTPLHAAARWGTVADVEQLLDYGADLNGGELLHDSLDASGPGWAVSAGNEELLRLMLWRGMDARHPRHREALHTAAARGSTAIVRLLIEHGANPRARDSHGQTPRERARAAGRAEAAALLEALGG
jgi:ankyrin repeat protein